MTKSQKINGLIKLVKAFLAETQNKIKIYATVTHNGDFAITYNGDTAIKNHLTGVKAFLDALRPAE